MNEVITKILEAAKKASEIEPELVLLEAETKGIRISCYSKSEKSVNYIVSWFEIECANTNTLLMHMDRCLREIKNVSPAQDK